MHILILSTFVLNIASLANVKSCVTVGMFGTVQSQWITSLRLSPLSNIYITLS